MYADNCPSAICVSLTKILGKTQSVFSETRTAEAFALSANARN